MVGKEKEKTVLSTVGGRYRVQAAEIAEGLLGTPTSNTEFQYNSTQINKYLMCLEKNLYGHLETS